MTLDELGIKYGTDKNSTWHNYLVEYEARILRTCRSLLEIGIAKGFSALMWNEYFDNNCDLWYLDLFLDTDNVSAKWARNRGIIPVEGSQDDLEVLASIKKKFEFIIDDGSHHSSHMIKSFKHLFMTNLLPGGTYFIEDTHCCTVPFYWDDKVKSFEDTPLWLFKNYLETGRIQNAYFNEGETHVFQNIIHSVEIVSKDQLIIIKRK